MAADTVEWGSDVEQRGRGPGQKRSRLLPSARHLAPVAGVLALLGLVLTMTSGTMPWRELTFTDEIPDRYEDYIEAIGSSHSAVHILGSASPVYYLNLTALLALTAVVLFGRPSARRAVCAAALGCAAGHALLLSGMVSTIRNAATTLGPLGGLPLDPEEDIAVSVGDGFYSGAAGLAFLVAALLLLSWGSRLDAPAPHVAVASASDAPPASTAPAPAQRASRVDFADEVPPGPADLTVAPAAPFHAERSPYAP
jgi:hypothetical protein